VIETGSNARKNGAASDRRPILLWTSKTRAGLSVGFSTKMIRRAHTSHPSMWVAQSHRRSRIGRTLVNAIIEWARLQGAATLQLVVTSNNHPAIEFYKSLGFSPTGKMAPYRNDPALNNIEMIRSISSQRSSD
jgi:ribosomal protein S18 acetylase RimI-like enzyme